MKKNEKIMVAVGFTSLALLAYNTHLNRKQAQMSGALGAISDPTTIESSVPPYTIDDTGTVSTVSTLADTYFNKAYSTFESMKQNPEVQEKLKDLGLDIYVKNLNAERLKNIMAGYGLFKLMGAIKGNALKVGIVGGGLLIASKNRQKIQDAYNDILA